MLGDRGGVRRAHEHQRNAAASERGHVDRVIAHTDARHDLQPARKRAFGCAEAREAKDCAVHLAA